jgi:hypothetical protein
MKFNIELPFFPGFYESDLENSDTSYWAIKDELEYYKEEYAYENPDEKAVYAQLEEDDLDFNYADYEKDVRDAWVDGFRENAPEFVLSVEDVEMTSPKYYNFSTDRLWADVELRDDWMDAVREFMVENADWLRKRIKEDWTSYDGFMSFMSNNFDNLSHDEDKDYWGDKSWYFHLFSGKSDRWECYIATIIGYMMLRENKNIRNDLVMFALDDIYAGQYVYITEEGKEKLQELRDQREEDIREGRIVLPDPDQLKIEFSE